MACEHTLEIIEIYEDVLKSKKLFSKPYGVRTYVLQCTKCGTLAKESIMINTNTKQVYSKYNEDDKPQFKLPE